MPRFDILKSLDAVRDRSDLSTTQKCVAMTLILRADGNGRCFPSYGRIAKDASVVRQTAVRAVGELVAKTVLTVEIRRDEAGDRTSNAYTINVVAQDDGVVALCDHPVAQDDQGGRPRGPRVVTHDDHGGRIKRPRRNPTKEPTSKEPIPAAEAAPFQLQIAEGKQKGEHQIIVDHYVEAFARTHGGEKPEIRAKDAKRAKDLRTKLGVAGACQVIDRWFSDAWRAERQPSLAQIDPNAASGRAAKSHVQAVPSTGSAWSMDPE